MEVKISSGNSKLGKIPSVSLPAGETCRSDCECSKKCYAKKLERLRKTVREAYQHNYDLLKNKPDIYWREVEASIMMSRFFRFHVSGDIPDEDYLIHMLEIAQRNPHCEILCFTKKFEIVNKILLSYPVPSNLHLILSGWAGLEMQNLFNLPEAHVSYWVPRRSMLKHRDKMVFFGLQAFIKEYLIGYFNDNFFGKTEEDVVSQYKETMNTQIGDGNYDIDKIVQLHRLGYLPLEIRALPEGTMVTMGIPCIEIINTHENFAWLVQWIECILQVELWKPCCHATIGNMYRNIADYWYDKTTDGMSGKLACADFGMRGMSCMDEAVRCSASWLLSFDKTSTIPAISYIDKYYNANCREEGIGIGAVSTEHSVMGANFSVDGDEITFVKRLLTELYPNTSFSMVSDTYDYWNMINNILPQCKEEIMDHHGKLLVRPDSGDIVDISVKTVEKLWEIFGGTTNSKGYKVLDPHIGIIYGDGCTLSNVDTIWRELEKRGFAANNIAYGVGAFCFTAIAEDGKLIVATRDTFGIAMKATYGIINGEKVMIYKDPKTDTSHLKKSHKGCCRVYEEDGQLKCQDQLMEMSDDSLLTTVFKDGAFVREDSFMDIRERMYGGK